LPSVAEAQSANTTPTVASSKVAAPTAPLPTSPVIPAPVTNELRGAIATGAGMSKRAASSAPPAASIGGFAAAAPARDAARSAAAPQRQLATSDMLVSAFVGCYELDQSADVLPRRFALVAAGEARYVDSTGSIDGKIPDVNWAEVNGRAVVRTIGRGDVLTLERGPATVTAQSTLGPRTVRTVSCR
jgi:hypothetical protein